jgi:hypothetical protein
LKVITAEETEEQEGRWRRSQRSQAHRTEERKCDTPLGYSGRITLRREQCGVFPSKNCNIETRSRDYATAEQGWAEPSRAAINT